MAGDMFLKIAGQKQGWIKGESVDAEHKDEIEVVEWSWGLSSPGDVAGPAASKRTFREVRIRKRVDGATTRLMNALSKHEPISSAVLSVRKAGKSQFDYFVVTIENAYVTTFDTQSTQLDGPAELHDVFTLTFNKVNVEYRPQGADGMLGGSSTFQDQLSTG